MAAGAEIRFATAESLLASVQVTALIVFAAKQFSSPCSTMAVYRSRSCWWSAFHRSEGSWRQGGVVIF